MLSSEHREQVSVLRMLLVDEEPAGLPLVMLAQGTVMPFQLAVKVVLADVEHLEDSARRDRGVSPERWHLLAADVATLYRLAVPGG